MSPRAFALAVVGLVVVTILGSVLDVMEVDAAQYASMSREMLGSDNWLQLHHRGQDYLDKPPLLFWLAGISFKLFGVHNWSYKLPSILFAFLGLFSTYRFAALHYGKELARTAALMFGGSAAFLLMTNDVRCDTILTASVITAIWLGSLWMEEGRWWQWFGCALAIAAGMLVKGPMGAMAPLLALGGEVVFKRRWHVLHVPGLYVIPLVVAALLVPMCIGLYQQHGWPGLRFYFWEQSFGRITGENRWKDDSSPFFFTHEVLWQALPWTLFVLAGLWTSIKAVARRQVLVEYASLTGIVLVFIALSLSHFKLPHYLYVIMPLFAVQGASAFHGVRWRGLRTMQLVLSILLYALLFVLLIVCFPVGATRFIAGAVVIGVALVRLRSNSAMEDLFTRAYWSWIVVAITVNAHFYPFLLKYQANAQAGRWAAARHLAEDRFFGLQVAGTALDFYSGHPVRWLSNADEARSVIAPGTVIYTDRAHYDDLISADLRPQWDTTLANYEVQLLGIDFVLPALRHHALEERYLLRY